MADTTPPERRSAPAHAARVVETGDPAIRVPPHSIEAEQAVLGAVMLDPGVWPAVNHLGASDFYRSDHRAVYEAIARLFDEGTVVDVVTVAEHLDRRGHDVVGLALLSDITDAAARPANAGAYAVKVRNHTRKRAYAALGAEVGEMAFSGSTSPDDIETRIHARLNALPVTADAAGLPTVTIADLIDRPDDATECLSTAFCRREDSPYCPASRRRGSRPRPAHLAARGSQRRAMA